MRVIAQDGTYSVPLDNAILEQVDCTVTATIGRTNYLLGTYNTEQEAQRALMGLNTAILSAKRMKFPYENAVCMMN